METAKVINTGDSQTVRFPSAYRFEEKELYVNKIGGVVILLPKNDSWSALRNSLDMFTEDYLSDGIDDLPVQERTAL